MNYKIMNELTSYKTLDEVKPKNYKNLDEETRNILVHLGYWQDNTHNPWKYTYDMDHMTAYGLIQTYEEKEPIISVIDIESDLPETYVFDENKSVKWNREKVTEHNKDVQKRKDLLNRLKEMIFETEKKYIIHEKTYDYLFFDYSEQNEEYYEIIWEKAYEEVKVLGMEAVQEKYYEIVEWLGKLEKKRH